MSTELLRVENLYVRYGAVEALRGVSLEVYSGEIVSLLGANGAGKTSLLSAIMRRLNPVSGKIFYQGKDLSRCKTHQLVQNGLAIVPEGRGILQSLTVLENLELGAYHRKDWKTDLDHIFHLFPVLKDRLKQNAGTLSGGEQQMLAIGRALLSKPRLLLLDEPSLGLAPKVIQNIFKLIKEIQLKGVSILLIEQNAHMAMKIADRVYVLETGNIVLQGAAEEMRAHEDIKKAYLGG